MSTLRYERATMYPRIAQTTPRGETMFLPDKDNPIVDVRVGVSSYESVRAEVIGHVETETAKMRIPMTWKGRSLRDMQPGALVVWDGSEWDVAIPPKIRNTRTHSVRHLTIEIKRRPLGTNVLGRP